jgi:excisionase family DNA binding protein
MNRSNPIANGEAERARSELLNVKAVADLLSCSPRTVYRLADSGSMPQPVRLGSLIRWRRSELFVWLNAGCPNLRRTRKGARQ